MPNAATEPSRQSKTPDGLSISNALTIPTPPAAKQPKTAQSNAVVLRELLSTVSLRSGISVCVVIKCLMIKPPNEKDNRRRATGTQNETRALARRSVHPLVRRCVSSSAFLNATVQALEKRVELLLVRGTKFNFALQHVSERINRIEIRWPSYRDTQALR